MTSTKDETKKAQAAREIAPYGWVIGRGGKRYPMPKPESIFE